MPIKAAIQQKVIYKENEYSVRFESLSLCRPAVADEKVEPVGCVPYQ